MSTKSKKELNYNRRRRFVKGKYGIILLVLLFFLAITIFLLLYTDLFLVNEIEINGNDYVEDSEILKKSNLEIGMNIFKFNIKKTQSDIILHPFIKESSISRVLPDKISLSIVEREVAAIIPFEDGNFLYLDDEGVVVEKSHLLKTYNIPLITGLEEISFIVGNTIEISPNWFKNSILNIVLILKENSLLHEISEIQLFEDYNVQLYTNAGSVIKIGNDKILQGKIEFVKSFISQSQPSVIVDISHGGTPVYKPRNNQEE